VGDVFFAAAANAGCCRGAAIDPVAATQTFFPEQIDVALVSPCAAARSTALLAQTEGRAGDRPDQWGRPPKILVLVPLPAPDYADARAGS